MDFHSAHTARAAHNDDTAHTPGSGDMRHVPRFTSLIRAAKLVCAQGEFVCVIRDVSEKGISVKTFHPLPTHHAMTLQLQNGEDYPLDFVRHDENQASFTFAGPIELERLVQEAWNFPKRQMRLAIYLPVKLVTLTGRVDAIISNLSQQGARLETDAIYGVNQKVTIQTDALPEIRATIRWRREGIYGCVFETMFKLPEFAHLAAMLQCPVLFQDAR